MKLPLNDANEQITSHHKQIHVMHVIRTLNQFGGTPVKLLYQIQHTSPDIKYTVVCMMQKGALAEKFSEQGVDVIAFDCMKNYDIRQLFRLISIIRKKNIGVVHTHFARSNSYGRIAAILTGKKMITSEHGVTRNTAPYLYFLDTILNLFTSFHVSNSFATKASSQKTIFANRKNMLVIHNGVPDISKRLTNTAKDNLRTELGLTKNELVILDVGSHTELRSHETLIKAVTEIKEKLPPFKIILVGDGPQRQSILQEVGKQRVSEYVVFLNRIPRDKVHQLMQLTDIYVNPAYAEGFGIATVEAMLVEKPIIYAKAGSLPELMIDGITGVSFPACNEKVLAEKIIKLVESNNFSKKLGIAARQYALNKFNIQRFIDDFETLYRTMAKNQTPS